MVTALVVPESTTLPFVVDRNEVSLEGFSTALVVVLPPFAVVTRAKDALELDVLLSAPPMSCVVDVSLAE